MSRLAARMLLRDWRGGELGVLLAALVIAVAIVTGISAFAARLQNSLEQESHRFLAADLAVSGPASFPPAWTEEARRRGLKLARTLSFASMVYRADEREESGENAPRLSAVKAVSAGYPLRGDLLMSAQPFGAARKAASGPPPGSVWLDSRLFPLLGVDIGSAVAVGEAAFTAAAAVRSEPDRAGGLGAFAPRALMHIDDIPATGIVQPGSRVEYRLLLAGAPAPLAAYRAWLQPRLRSGERILDVAGSERRVGSALELAESFLLLAGSLAVVLAGVAIALAARRFSERHYDYVAIMKSLGADSARINRLYGLSLLAVGGIAAGIGALLGWALQAGFFALFRDALPIVPGGGSGMRPYLFGAATALVCLASFAWPPLGRLRAASPLRVLRRDLPGAAARGAMDNATGLGAVLLLMLWYSGDLSLTAAVLAGICASAGLAAGAAALLLRGGHAAGMRAGSAWRLALAGLRRRGGENILQVVIFSLAIMLLLVLALLRTSMIEEWREQLPPGAPNHFLLNIAPGEVAGARAALQRLGADTAPFYPMIRGRITHVNGEALRRGVGDGQDERDELGERDGRGEQGEGARGERNERGARDGWNESARGEQDERAERGTDRREWDINLTWSAAIPEGNEIIAGRWWPPGTTEALVSVEEGIAEELGIEVGDQVRYRIGAATVEAFAASIRRLDWQSMQPNFFMVFPPAALEGLPATFMTAFHLEGGEKRALNGFIRAFPTVTVIEMDVVIAQVRGIIRQASAAVELVLGVILIAGTLVLIAGVQASVDARLREAAILRALGASRKLIQGSLLIEFAALGLCAGLLAAAAAEIAAFILQTWTLDMRYAPRPALWLLGPLAAIPLIAALGLWNTRRVVSSPPARVLMNLS